MLKACEWSQPLPALLACSMAALVPRERLEVFMFLVWFCTSVRARFNCLRLGLVSRSY